MSLTDLSFLRTLCLSNQNYSTRENEICRFDDRIKPSSRILIVYISIKRGNYDNEKRNTTS